MEKIFATVLHQPYRRQVEEAIDSFDDGPESFYGSSMKRCLEG